MIRRITTVSNPKQVTQTTFTFAYPTMETPEQCSKSVES